MPNTQTNGHNPYLHRLTADNCAMLLIDHQTGTMLGVQDIRLDQKADKEGIPGLKTASVGVR